MSRFLICCGAWLGMSLVAMACEPNEVDGDDESGDGYVKKELLKEGEYAEAKEWLAPKHKNHHLWKVKRKTVVKLVDDLYAAGAVKVYAAGFEKEDDPQVVATFVAELPTDAGKRKKVIDFNNKFWRGYLSEEDEEELDDFMVKDTGQKYVVFGFDL